MKDVFDERSLDKLMPEVKEFQMDYRREVDRLLKATCEQFIKESAQKVVGPIATSLSKLKSISAGDISDKVSESMRNLKKILPIVQEKMSLYLANKETEFILYKPIRVSKKVFIFFFIYILDFLFYVILIQKHLKPHDDNIHKRSDCC